MTRSPDRVRARSSPAGPGWPRLAVLTALLALPCGAAAAEGPAPVPRPGAAAVRLPSPAVASLLSTAAVAVPLIASSQVSKHASSDTRSFNQAALLTTGVVLGPAAGYVYGGCGRRGLKGVGARMAGAVIVFALADMGVSAGEGGGVVIVPAVGIASLVAASAIWDLGTVATKVENRNAQRASMGVRLGTAPFSGAPALAYGLRW